MFPAGVWYYWLFILQVCCVSPKVLSDYTRGPPVTYFYVSRIDIPTHEEWPDVMETGIESRKTILLDTKLCTCAGEKRASRHFSWKVQWAEDPFIIDERSEPSEALCTANLSKLYTLKQTKAWDENKSCFLDCFLAWKREKKKSGGKVCDKKARGTQSIMLNQLRTIPKQKQARASA